MNPPNYMAYVIVGGAILVSFLAPVFIGFGDAWFVPLIILALGAIYLVFDARMRRRDPDANR